MNESALGITHFASQADIVARFIIVALILASLLTWGIIVDRLINHWLLKRRSIDFHTRFTRARSLSEVIRSVESVMYEPGTRLTQIAVDSATHYAAHDVSHLEAAGGLSEFLMRALRQGIDEETERLERGLTLLASVGSTAPFVGLFGTVWGIYHALLAIGISGQGTLDKVAGPVGEALIMTALGLAVAIPAVLGYNTLIRRNRVVLRRLEAFGHDLLTLVLTGAQLERGERSSASVFAGAV